MALSADFLQSVDVVIDFTDPQVGTPEHGGLRPCR